MRVFAIDAGPIFLNGSSWYYTYHIRQSAQAVYDLRCKKPFSSKLSAKTAQTLFIKELRKKHGLLNSKQKRVCSSCGKVHLTILPPIEAGDRFDNWLALRCACGSNLPFGEQTGLEEPANRIRKRRKSI